MTTENKISAAEIAEWRFLQGEGMVSAVGEYTPEEFWWLLDAYETQRKALTIAERALVGAYGEPVDGASLQSVVGIEAIKAVRSALE